MDEANRYRGLVRTSLTAGTVMSAIATGALAIGLATGLVPSSIVGVRELIAVEIRGFGAGALAGGLFGRFVARAARPPAAERAGWECGPAASVDSRSRSATVRCNER